MIKIIAKGPVKDVRKLAAKHEIEGLVIDKRVGREVLAHCPENEKNNYQIGRWFVDPDTGFEAPFSPGACLWYGWEDSEV